MAAFPELNWFRFDVSAIVGSRGLGVVKPAYREACHAWLNRNGYAIHTIDFKEGIGPAVVSIGILFRWEEQFGHTLSAESRNLDALRDGFELTSETGQVLELLNADVAYREDARWLLGLLSISVEHTMQKLAVGSRFFSVLVLASGSELPGVTYEAGHTIPVPYHGRYGQVNLFTD